METTGAGANKINIGLLFTALFGVFILSGLFALFISTRSWHWTVRATILIASGLPFLLVDAGELTLVLLVSQFQVFLAIQYERARRSNLKRSGEAEPDRLFFVPSFKLADLCLAIAIASAIMALLSQAIRMDFPELVHLAGVGTAIGIWSLSGIALVYWKFPWRKKAGLALLAMSATLVWAAYDDPRFGQGGQFDALVFWLIFLLVIASIELLMFWIYRRSVFSTGATDSRPAKTIGAKVVPAMATLALVIIALGFAGPTIACFVWLMMPPQLPQPGQGIVENQPNGFAELSEAGSEFSKSPYLSTSVPINPGQLLRDEVAACSKTFEKIDLALSRGTITCFDLTALNPEKDTLLEAEMMDSFQDIRNVARALSLKARQEIHDGNYDEAMNDGLRCVRATQSLNDCILVAHLVGIACEGIGSDPISLAIEHATSAKLKEAAQTLREIEADSTPLQQIIANDSYYMWSLHDWKMRLFWGAHQMKPGSPQSEQIVAARARRDAIRGQLRVAIALELHKREQGDYPDELENLVPVYLDEVPEDPFSLDTPRKSLRYKRINKGQYKLYSISLDRVDQGGEAATTGWIEGDLNHAANVRQNEEDYRRNVEEREQAEKENSGDLN